MARPPPFPTAFLLWSPWVRLQGTTWKPSLGHTQILLGSAKSFKKLKFVGNVGKTNYPLKIQILNFS